MDPPLSILEDICMKFILTAPKECAIDSYRVLFLVEEAWWYYEDKVREINKHYFEFKTYEGFALTLYERCEALIPYRSLLPSMFKEYNRFLRSIPVCGAIILDKSLELVLLVQDTKTSTWSFPKGKIHLKETEVDCAVREVHEETRLDISPYIHAEDKISLRIKGKQVNLFIISGLDPNTQLVGANCGQEIRAHAWHRVRDLPITPEDCAQQYISDDGVLYKFCKVHFFVPQLKIWIDERRSRNVIENGPDNGNGNGNGKNKEGQVKVKSKKKKKLAIAKAPDTAQVPATCPDSPSSVIEASAADQTSDSSNSDSAAKPAAPQSITNETNSNSSSGTTTASSELLSNKTETKETQGTTATQPPPAVPAPPLGQSKRSASRAAREGVQSADLDVASPTSAPCATGTGTSGGSVASDDGMTAVPSTGNGNGADGAKHKDAAALLSNLFLTAKQRHLQQQQQQVQVTVANASSLDDGALSRVIDSAPSFAAKAHAKTLPPSHPLNNLFGSVTKTTTTTMATRVHGEVAQSTQPAAASSSSSAGASFSAAASTLISAPSSAKAEFNNILMGHIIQGSKQPDGGLNRPDVLAASISAGAAGSSLRSFRFNTATILSHFQQPSKPAV